MTPAEVKARVDAIDALLASTHDNEVAHGMEDALFVDVLKAISRGAADPAGLARAALVANRLDYERWYA